MTDHSRIFDLVPLYALDALDTAETTEVEDHVAGCELCQEELADHRCVAAQLVPDRPAPGHLWERIEAQLAVRSNVVVQDLATHRNRRPNPLRWVAAAAALVALLFAGVFVGGRLALRDLATDQGVTAAADSAAAEPGSLVEEFLVDGVSVARVVLTRDGLGYIIPTDALDALGDDRTYQLWVLTPDEIAISAGVLGNDPAPATFTWKGDLAGFALTREVAGGVVSSAGDVVSVITEA